MRGRSQHAGHGHDDTCGCPKAGQYILRTLIYVQFDIRTMRLSYDVTLLDITSADSS